MGAIYNGIPGVWIDSLAGSSFETSNVKWALSYKSYTADGATLS